jgi:phosphinothricin acetyltransferase
VSDIWLRDATLEDAATIQSIYAPIVDTTHISFELESPSVDEMRRRIEQVTRNLPWLVAADGDEVVGYAYATPHAERAAYRWAVDTSVYLAEEARGRGIGKAIYKDLLHQLRGCGYVSAYAGIALPNDASVALHERLGFVAVGSFPTAGFKLGRWIDVSLWRCALSEPPAAPAIPTQWRNA